MANTKRNPSGKKSSSVLCGHCAQPENDGAIAHLSTCPDRVLDDARTYEIDGELYRGNETPSFRARLLFRGVPIASLESDGGGGCARVIWLVESMAERAAAADWLASEARRLWPSEYGAPPAFLSKPYEAAILVVPEHIGAPMDARYHVRGAMKAGESCDLRVLLDATRDPNMQRAIRRLDVGEVLPGAVAVERLS